MKNILLIGLGRFGKHIAMQLNQMGHEIMAVDINEERVNKVLPFVTNAQIGDSTDAQFLESLGIGNFEVSIELLSSTMMEITATLVSMLVLRVIHTIIIAVQCPHGTFLLNRAIYY